jgi:small GTP-binding protein
MKVVKKICLIGRFAVGKTSLVKQYIDNQFNEKYKTTVGVSISTKQLQFDDIDMSLVIWDIAGFEQENHYNNYLRGAQGLIWVIDGTEPESLKILKTISDSMPEIKQVPSLCFINKHDLLEEWVIGEKEIENLESSFQLVFKTSAKTGENVEEGFKQLAESLLR